MYVGTIYSSARHGIGFPGFPCLHDGSLSVVEEPGGQGGAGTTGAARLLETGHAPRRVAHRHALGYRSGRYGSQKFHRKENGLDADSILALAASNPASNGR